MLDYLILGGGPAGLQLGYYLQRAGHRYRILEAGEAPGTFFATFPRHRQLLSINKRYTGYDDPEINLRWDWNSLLSEEGDGPLFRDYSRDYFPDAGDLRRYFGDFARRFGLAIEHGVRVERVSQAEDGSFVARAEDGAEHRARRLIVATGVSRPYLPEIPGIEHAELYGEVSIDPEDFAGQRVLIVGKGNSAFETADNLIATASLIHLASPNPVRMAWQSHFVGHLRAVNNNLLDSYQLKSQNAVLDADVERIEPDGDRFRVHLAYAHAHGEREVLEYDRVIACTGFAFDDSIFDDSCRPALVLDGRFPAQTSEWESTTVEGLYFAGVLTQVRDYKKSTSAFIHGFRYNVRALHRILERKYHGAPWPSRELPNDPEALRDAVIERVNRSSALWQQFGFLADVITVGDDGARYHPEMPVDFVHNSGVAGDGHSFLVTLEYGSAELPDPFNVLRIARDDVDRADRSQFLHPVIRHYRGPELLAEHHVIEDLAAEWVEEVHTEPLLHFFERQLADRRVGRRAAAAGG